MSGRHEGPSPVRKLTRLPPRLDRAFEAALWAFSLALVHLTFDVLVHHQYAVTFSWKPVLVRTLQAFVALFVLIFVLHPHPASRTVVPGLPPRLQYLLLHAIFFAAAVTAGCTLVTVTNDKGYMAVMKRAPPLACLWLWAVLELELIPALLSLASVGFLMWRSGYSIDFFR